MRTAKANFYVSIIESAKVNSKKIWQTIDKITGKTDKGREIELQINNQLVNNPIVVATEFNTFVKNSALEISQLLSPRENISYSVNKSSLMFTIAEINESEVVTIINELKQSKAKDIYGLDTNFLKVHRDSLICLITHMINLSIRNSVVPTAWKIATITPVFKSGNKTRPISILLVILRSGF